MRSFFFIFSVSALLVVPILAFAQINNPEGTVTQLVTCSGPDCDWAALVRLGSNILNFFVYLSIMAAAIMFAYAGFLYMADGGSMSKVKEAHGIFTAVAVGIIIVLVAWLAVDTLLKTMTDKGIREWSNPAQNELLLPRRA